MSLNLHKLFSSYKSASKINNKSKLFAFLEIIIPWLLVTITIQFFLKGTHFWVKFISIPIVLFIIILGQKTLKISAHEQGFKPKKWKEPILYLVLPSVLIGIIFLIIGILKDTIATRFSPTLMIYVTLVGYPIWGMIQQYIVIVYLFIRLQKFIRNDYILILITGLIFSTTHLPNPLLVLLTFPMSIIFLIFFLKYKNIYLLGFAHGFMGALGKFCLPESLTNKFWIGNLIKWETIIKFFNIN